ncbi:MAG: hypothetical protein A2046_09170 [Bacteroidetes bacterium GWA2_30_7]|nr:MAG: hypothetical protein A2046_09170 [Bacteroidetes bacterium GWA2_30_7]
MQTFSVTINNDANAKLFLNLMKQLKFVKAVTVENTVDKLSDEDWIKPGRPATDEELEQLCVEMEADKGGITTDVLKKRMKKWIAKKQL